MKLTARKVLVLALVLIFVGYIGAALVQTDFGNVEITELKYVGEMGLAQSAVIYKPDTASADNPAPCIILEHGWYNNKEMQDMNCVEYARRGYVVVALDQYSHGDSDRIGIGYEYTGGNGMNECIKMVADIPYVDNTRIGISGHSFGSDACTYATYMDEENLISTILMVCSDPQYTANFGYEGWPRTIYLIDEAQGGYVNVYGARNVAYVACQYDEFYHGIRDGSEGELGPGMGYSSPNDLVTTEACQSFLYFGTDRDGREVRVPNTFYKEDVDGKEVIRAVFNPAITHPEATMNASVMEFALRYFEEAMPAPNPIASDNQVWQWKAIFNSLSLHSMILFIGALAICLLDTGYFKSLRAEKEVVALPAPKGKSAVWYWCGIVVVALFAAVSFPTMFDGLEAKYPNLYSYVYDGNAPFFKQWPVTFVGCWSVACAAVLGLVTFLSYKLNGKKNGVNLAERGVKIGLGKLWKSVVLALAVACSAVLLIFVGDWLWDVDARIWVIALRTFESDKLVEILKYLPFFLIYYITMSVAVNSINYVKLGKEWVNVVIEIVAVIAGPVLFYAAQYITFHSAGYLLTELSGLGSGSVITGIWVYPLLFWLPCGVLVSRSIYKRTNNPYIGGIIMAIMVTVANCANTITFI